MDDKPLPAPRINYTVTAEVDIVVTVSEPASQDDAIKEAKRMARKRLECAGPAGILITKLEPDWAMATLPLDYPALPGELQTGSVVIATYVENPNSGDLMFVQQASRNSREVYCIGVGHASNFNVTMLRPFASLWGRRSGKLPQYPQEALKKIMDNYDLVKNKMPTVIFFNEEGAP